MTIISSKYNFIFVKTRKTAGTSTEVELSRVVEKRAIVTPILPPEPGHEPRNFQGGWFRKPYYNHMPAALIRSYLGDRSFFAKFRFCVERHPISKCISHYHMLYDTQVLKGTAEPYLTWSEYVLAGNFPIDVDKYVDVVDGKRVLVVNEIIPYEEIDAGLNRIGIQLGLGPIKLTTRAKGEYSKRLLIKPEDVTVEERRRIMDAFAESLHFSGLGSYYQARDAGQEG